MNIEYVEWVDAAGCEGWHAPGQKEYKICRVASVGFVVHEDDELLVLAQTFSAEDGMHNNRSKIPKVCITKRQKLPQSRRKK